MFWNGKIYSERGASAALSLPLITPLSRHSTQHLCRAHTLSQSKRVRCVQIRHPAELSPPDSLALIHSYLRCPPLHTLPHMKFTHPDRSEKWDTIVCAWTCIINFARKYNFRCKPMQEENRGFVNLELLEIENVCSLLGTTGQRACITFIERQN